jgi:UDP-glucose 4-epimerase
MLLVTGGAGFIGSNLVVRLVEQGEEVRILDNFSSGKLENLEAVRGRIDLVEGDLRDDDVVRRAVLGADVVFHQAAVASVPQSIADPRTTFDVNVTGTLNVLRAAHHAGCRRVVFASSSAVYGDGPEMPKREEMTPNPLSPYAVSKLSGEQLCSVWMRVFGVETVALRYFNVFGPRQDPESQYAAAIPRFLSILEECGEPVIYGDGDQSRDFVYVDDVVDANLRAAAAPNAAGRAFNIAAGRAVTVNAVVALMAGLLNVEPRPRHEPGREGEVRHSLADISAARQTLGYAPRVSLAQGLERILVAARPVCVG